VSLGIGSLLSEKWSTEVARRALYHPNWLPMGPRLLKYCHQERILPVFFSCHPSFIISFPFLCFGLPPLFGFRDELEAPHSYMELWEEMRRPVLTSTIE
jgi:hypothetical protein